MNDIKNLKFQGVIENPKDDRDYAISRFIPRVDIIKDEEFILPLPKREVILNQGYYNSCVGHSFALCKSILEYQQTHKWIDFSPYMIYGTRYAEDGYDGEGMYPRQGARVLHKEGAYLIKQFDVAGEMPQIAKMVGAFKQKNPEAVKEAENFKIDGYSFVTGNNQIRAALKNGMPVSAAWELFENFYNVKDDGIVPLPEGAYVGNHQMTIVGWTKTHWVVLNSWGTGMGMKGVYYIPFGYNPHSAIAVTDTITPIKPKAKTVCLKIDSDTIMIDGIEQKIDVAPFIKDNRTFIPARFVSEALGASVEWVASEKKVIIRSEEKNIELVVDSKRYVVDGKKYENDVAPFIKNDRTFLPVRLISELLYCEVIWDGADQRITISAL